MTDTLFSKDSADQVENDFDSRFIKEDGALDVDALKTYYEHSNRHIKKIEGEQEGLRKDLESRITMEKLMERLDKGPTSSPISAHHSGNDHKETPNSELPDFDKMIEDKLTKAQIASQRERNVRSVMEELTKNWGPNYVSRLEAVGKELGVGPQFLDNLAAENPRAFFRLVSDTKQSQASFQAPKTQVNSAAQTGRKAGATKAYYDKMRREDPNRYWSVSIQNEIHALGEDYFK